MRSYRTPSPRWAAIALAAAACVQPALAVDYVWLGNSGNWEDPTKWTLLGVPGNGDTATINNTSSGSVVLDSTRTIDRLTMNGGRIGGAGTLNMNRLVFNGGGLGGTSFGPGGTVNVAGNAEFNGLGVQNVALSHALNLNGNAVWGAGNGRINIDSAYSAGTNTYAAAAINVAAGTTFTDQGAASATAFKQISGGGDFNNAGTYRRAGLGETYAVNFNNSGTLDVVEGRFAFASSNYRSSSSGLIQVAAGANLWVANTTFTAGSRLVNNGVAHVYAGDVTLEAGATIGGIWSMDAGQLDVNGTQTISSLTFNGGSVGKAGTLNVGTFNFNGGTLGAAFTGPGGTVNVSGASTFNGNSTLALNYSHKLNVNGDATWTAGNGRINIDPGYSTSNASFASAALSISTGTTFTDQGAASASGFKVLGSGLTANAGTYSRNGLGTTTARNFQNSGQLNVNSGTFEVDQKFVNSGTVRVAAGATLAALEGGFANAGVFTGTGTVKTFRITDALANSGTIDPGSSSAVGTLTIAGDLSMADSATLRIDLANGGLSDRLAVTSDVLWNGELAIWATPGLTLLGGEVFTIATYGQRLSASTFDSVTWHGLNSQLFTVAYGANDITLRVSAVPEPGSVLLMLAGMAFVGAAARRRLAQT